MNWELKLIETYNFLRKYYPTILLVVFASLICLNLFVYYQYVYLPTKAQADSNIEKTVIDAEILDEVLIDIKEREGNLSRVKKTRYADPFN